MQENKRLKTVIYVITAIAVVALSFTWGFMTSRCSRKKETASFEWAVKTIREYYYEDVPAEVILSGSLKSFAQNYLDPYSAYYTKEEYEALVASNSGSMSGVGVSYMFISPEDNHPQGKSGVLIESVVGNSPASKARNVDPDGEDGLHAGEFVTSATYGGVTIQFDSDDSFSKFIKQRSTGEKFIFNTDRGSYELSKENYSASYCYMSTADYTWTINYDGGSMNVEKSDGGISCLREGSAYLRLDQFYGKAADEMAELIGYFNAENCTSLILDLRGNGGGYVDVMCDISNIFTGQLANPYSTAMQAVYKNGKVEKYSVNKKYTSSKQLPAGTKVSVLADNGTASASEALIGVLVDNGVIDYGDIYLSDLSEAYLKRTRTQDKNCRSYGKGIMQTTFTNPSTGEALKLTTAKIYWPKGETCIHGVGLTEEMGCNTVEAAWDVTYGDEQLALAVDKIYGAAT